MLVVRARSAGDPVAHHRHRPRQALQRWSSSRARQGRGSCAGCSRRPISSRKAIARTRSRRSASAPEDAARINPGIVYVTLSAYGHAGPWAERRGFDSLVQTTTGFNHAEGRGRRRRRAEGTAGADARSRHRLSDGVRRDDGARHARRAKAGAGTCGCRWRRPAAGCGISAGSTEGLRRAGSDGGGVHAAVHRGHASLALVRCRRCAIPRVLSTTPAFWARPADAARQSMPPQWPVASLTLTLSAMQYFNANRKLRRRFLDCLKSQVGTISASDRAVVCRRSSQT